MIEGIVLGVVSLLAALVMHEAAHALALRGMGLRIEEAGLGLTLPPRVVVEVDRLPFRLSLSPWLLGAYVLPHADDREKVDALPYRDNSWYLGAGITVNIAVGLCVMGASEVSRNPLKAAVMVAAAVAIAGMRRWFAAVVVPLLGVAVTVVTAYVLVAHPDQGGGTGGLVALARHYGSSWGEAVAFFGMVSLSLGLLNAAPFYPMDGGKIADAALGAVGARKGFLKWFRATGLAGVLVMILYSNSLDVVHLFT